MSCCVCQLESNDYLHTKFGINEIFGFSKKKKKNPEGYAKTLFYGGGHLGFLFHTKKNRHIVNNHPKIIPVKFVVK
jgi:hypothetical protein